MTTQDKREMYKHNMRVGTENAHKHGLSWMAIEKILQQQLAFVQAKIAASKCAP